MSGGGGWWVSCCLHSFNHANNSCLHFHILWENWTYQRLFTEIWSCKRPLFSVPKGAPQPPHAPTLLPPYFMPPKPPPHTNCTVNIILYTAGSGRNKTSWNPRTGHMKKAAHVFSQFEMQQMTLSARQKNLTHSLFLCR